MDAVEGGRERRTQYVVLSRISADLYEEMVALFSAWPGIEVVVDRRHEPRFSRGFLAPIRLHVEERRPAHPGMMPGDKLVGWDVWGD